MLVSINFDLNQFKLYSFTWAFLVWVSINDFTVSVLKKQNNTWRFISLFSRSNSLKTKNDKTKRLKLNFHYSVIKSTCLSDDCAASAPSPR